MHLHLCFNNEYFGVWENLLFMEMECHTAESCPIPPYSASQVYYLPPVGTQGFRSPEGSQLVVANASDVIVPQLTPRSDVWSFGILILRLFLGVEGPSSQREVYYSLSI